jgi:tetratricopeptide (TPR) repeat protein/transglutaminase-like putative cysteine protease
MRTIVVVASAAMSLYLAAPARAGDTPLYQPAADWVVPTKAPDSAGSATLAKFDVQHRIENGRLFSYVDQARRITSAEMLAQAATLTLPWSPDKGDLIIHDVSILRGAERIDLLAQGQKFTVLRREQTLEQRELTGILTATMAVEGLQVGDVLQLRFTVTAKDDALDGRVQDVVLLPAMPARADFAQARFSWPTGEKLHWQLLGEGFKGAPVKKGAYSEIVLALPLPKQTEMPDDAPSRYRHPPFMELSTFADWADVSRVMAPLYATDGTIAPDGALAQEVATIEKADASPTGRAQRALELVQDKIRYLAVGMDGGNYVPQAPARTWATRYGDCKAKSLLLLALLRTMGIAAEPVLANIGMGDFVPDRLPSAAAFNHVLVRVTIDGQTYWMDGTGSGSRMADIRDTPPFGQVLPVRSAGATLMAIETHANARPMIDISVDADESGSVDLPSAFLATAVVNGPAAAQMTLAKNQLGEKEQRDAVRGLLQTFLGEGQYSDATITPDSASGTVTLRASGVMTTRWVTDDRRRKRGLSRVLDQMSFAPDRSKASWAAIPVAVSPPVGARYRLRLKLPENGRDFTIDGERDASEQLAGFKIVRSLKLEGGVVTLDERMDSIGGEIPAARIPAERDAVATTQARAPRLVAPVDTPRRWDVIADGKRSSQVEAIKAVFAKTIAADPDEVSGYTSRASFMEGTGDWKGALADRTRAVQIAPSVDSYLARATTAYELGDTNGALADAEAARALDPSSEAAIGRVAFLKAERGDLPGALALLEQRIALGGEMRSAYRASKAGLLAQFGKVEESIAIYDDLIAQKPGSPSLMNQRCWAKGTRSVMLDSALKDCTGAIELSNDTAAALDSRAMVWYRMGRYDEALKDLDAVLAGTPGQSDSRFMRAVVLRALHRDADAVKDAAIARRLDPSVDRQYALYGIKLP